MLDAVKGNEKRRLAALDKIAVWDIETRGGLHGDLEMIGFFDGSETRIFGSVKDFLSFILARRFRGFRFYAHYGADFDFKFIVDSLLDFRVDGEIYEIGEKYFYIRLLSAGNKIREIVIKDGRKHVFRILDSSFLIPSSLAQATRAFGVKHMKTQIDFNRIYIHDSDSRRYCLNDCIGLYEVLMAYFKQKPFRGLEPRGTIASNAMQIFRTTMKTGIRELDRRAEKFVRRSYYGGRVEVFKLAGNSLYHYDFNSLYPAVMAENRFPVGRPAWADRYEKGYPGFYLAEVDVPRDLYIPPLPFLKGGKLIFPVGRFTGFFTSLELDRLLSLGGRVRVRTGLVFDRTEPIFKDYVRLWYDIKRNSERGSSRYMTAKLYLNGLYGKFGQKRKQSGLIRCSADEAARKGYRPWMPELGLYSEVQYSRGRYILPHIASWVTALARLKLYDALTAARDPHYCDTDSIYDTAPFPSDPGRLGALKYEGIIRRAVFLSSKLYQADGRVKAKGFGRDFAKNLTPEDFEAALRGDRSAFNMERDGLLGIREALKRYGTAHKVGKKRKSFRNAYDKRIIVNEVETKPRCLNGDVVQIQKR